MDATALRWVLAVIGVLVIVGVYLFSVYQSRLRRSAAIKTYTQEELDNVDIADQEFRDELAHINTLLEQDVAPDDVGEIRINPALDADRKPGDTSQHLIEVPRAVLDISVEDRVVHVLKATSNRYYTAEELSDALRHAGIEAAAQPGIRVAIDDETGFTLIALTSSGSLAELDQPGFCAHGLVCYFDRTRVGRPAESYELMLKKIDEMVRLLEMKVYDERLQLLTLQQVTEIRGRLAHGGA